MKGGEELEYGSKEEDARELEWCEHDEKNNNGAHDCDGIKVTVCVHLKPQSMRINEDALHHMARFLPSNHHPQLMGALASVNSDFYDAFQEEAEDRRYAALKDYIADDLEFNHGFIADPDSADESESPMQTFVLGDSDENVVVYLCRGPGSSVIFTSEVVHWDNLPFYSKAEWDRFSPWVRLPPLVDLNAFA